jgi:hypothetical protein
MFTTTSEDVLDEINRIRVQVEHFNNVDRLIRFTKVDVQLVVIVSVDYCTLAFL